MRTPVFTGSCPALATPFDQNGNINYDVFGKLIDDQIADGDLHLLRFCPHAWISPDEETRFERMPTEFGPVDLRFRLSEDGRTLNLTFRGDWREKPRRLVLHTPQLPGLERIVVNGRDCGKTKEIILTT